MCAAFATTSDCSVSFPFPGRLSYLRGLAAVNNFVSLLFAVRLQGPGLVPFGTSSRGLLTRFSALCFEGAVTLVSFSSLSTSLFLLLFFFASSSSACEPVVAEATAAPLHWTDAAN
jgi:hypothetical protein